MKTLKTAAMALVIVLSSCTHVKQLGKLNMVSNRNIESSAHYELKRSYMGGSKSELKENKGKTLDEAIDNIVRNTPNGEFLKNAKIYQVNTLFSKCFAVEGDIWGLPGEGNFQGYKVGDQVQWRGTFKTITGTITQLKNEKTALVKTSEGKVKEIEYTKLLKLN